MAKWANDDVMDGALDVIAVSNQMTACSQQPTTRLEAITTYMLATTPMTPVTDFTKSNGDVSGRKVRVAAKSGITIANAGTANHVALVDGTRLLYVTTCTAQALSPPSTVNFPVWDVEFADPV